MIDLSAANQFADPFPAIVAAKTLALLRQKRAILYPSGKVFRVEQRPGRLVVVVFPDQVNQDKVNEGFAHELSTLLYGRPVVFMNHRGLYFQVGREIPPVVELASIHLDLFTQPTPWSLPIGTTAKGPLWIGLEDADRILIGGLPNGGKSGLLHGVVQALLHGGKTEVWAWDGKDGMEFARYIGKEHFHYLHRNGFQRGLAEIAAEAKRRQTFLVQSKCPPSVRVYNRIGKGFLPPIALIVDEIAEVEDQVTLAEFVRLYRAVGVHPIFATNNPSKAGVLAKSQMSTRMSFRTVSHHDSGTILGHTGAEKLPDIQGRGLTMHGGRMVEFQTFTVEFPEISDEALAWLAEQSTVIDMADEAQAKATEIINARILNLIEDGESDFEIVRQVWNVSGGRSFYTYRDRVQALRTTSSTSTSGDSLLKTPKNRGGSAEVEEVIREEEGQHD